MKAQRKTEIKVGATVLAGFVILLVGFAVFKEWTLFSSQKNVTMRFPASGGLKSGDMVSLNGVSIGKVSSVALDKNTVIVVAAVNNSTTLMEGAAPVIQMLELMGGKKVEIFQGDGTTEIPASTIIEGTLDPDIAGALHLIGELEGNIRDIGENANTLMENTNAIIGDEEFVASVKDAAKNVRGLLVEARAVLAENRTDIREIARTMNALSNNADSLLTALAPRLDATLHSTDRTLNSADTLLTSLNAVVDDIRHGDGTVSRVLYDSTLFTRFDQIATKLDSVLQIMMDDQLRIRIGL